MRVIAVKTLKLYAKKKIEAEQPLLVWYDKACKAVWKNHKELKAQIGNASVIGDKRIVFNIHGNKYRLIVDIEYIYCNRHKKQVGNKSHNNNVFKSY